MRVLKMRKTRLLKIVVACCFLIIILYLLFTNSSKIQTVHQSQRLSPLPRIALQVPELQDVNGNFEPSEHSTVISSREGITHSPGEGGKPHILREDQENDAAESITEYGMNMVCSNEIPLSRTIPDLRLPECKRWNYPENLPKASVIIVFHNEGWSVLLRTVQSVINRSPPQLLEEVLLVDDFSTKKDLLRKLDDFIHIYEGKVRLIRNKEREGLIRTRSRGAAEAKGDVILFLDAHCEVGINWLPPLLAPIHRDKRTMTVPVIDGIDHNTFQYRTVYQEGHHFRGIFEWGMLYKENELPDRVAAERKHNSEPYKSPTHAGGLFAMNRQYFLELGAYDPGLLVWGGENFELSFKIWQCGGSIEWVPCSRVGHVYRAFMPYNFGNLAKKKKGPLITINYKRVIETWFDDRHKEFFYTREPLARFLDMGDISHQLALKERLKCHNFQWYMDNVAFDVLDKFPELPPNIHWGELTNTAAAGSWVAERDAPTPIIFGQQLTKATEGDSADSKLRNAASQTCMDTLGHGPPALFGMAHCNGRGNNQLFRLNAQGQLGLGERCVEGDKQGIKLVFCRLGSVNGHWQYDETTHTLLHRVHKKCIALHPQTFHLLLLPCDPINTYQQWTFKEIHPNY